MKLKAKTKQNQARCQETKPAPFNIEQEITYEDIFFLQYSALTGYIMYLIGLFLPYYKSIDQFKLGIDVLFFGDLYLWMLIVVIILCSIGIARKKNYFRWIIPNSIVCTIEVLMRIMLFHFKFNYSFSIFLLGTGYFLIHIGTLIIWCSILLYWGLVNFCKQQKKAERDSRNVNKKK